MDEGLLLSNTHVWEKTRGKKVFEISNHLGNVLATVSDKKLGVGNGSDGIVDSYTVQVQSASDYFPFGWTMPSRKYNSGNYRFGFNGMEKNPEIETGNYDFGARVYDGRIGRWWSVDPLAAKFASSSPYNFVINSPLIHIDPDGRDVYLVIFATKDGDFGHAVIVVDLYDSNGEKTGKVRYFELNPAVGVNGLGALFSVEADYDAPLKKMTLDDLINTDAIYENYTEVEPEDRKIPDGAIRIKTDVVTDKRIVDKLIQVKRKNKKYNAVKYNCTDYVCEGLEIVIKDVKALAEERIGILTVKESKTPNQLYENLAKEAKKDERIEILKDSKGKTKKLFLEGLGMEKLGAKQRKNQDKGKAKEKKSNDDFIPNVRF